MTSRANDGLVALGMSPVSPRLLDTQSRSGPLIANLEVAWRDRKSSGTFWDLDGNLLRIGFLPTSSVPSIGTAISIRANVGSQKLSLSATVNRRFQSNGTVLVIECTLQSDPQRPRNQQRRANRRFAVGSLFPAFCFTRHPVDGRTIPFRIADISSGGLGLRASEAPLLLPGMKLGCRVDVPSIGTFTADLLVSYVEKSDGGMYRIATEFESLGKVDRNVVAQCLTSASTGNSISELRREGLLPGHWVTLLQMNLRSVAHPTAPHIQVSGKLGDTTVCSCIVDFSKDVRSPLSCLYLSSVLDQTLLRHWLEQRVHDPNFSPSPQHRNTDFSRNPAHTRRKSSLRRFWKLKSDDAPVRWDEYAEAYDTMCSANPAYQENLSIFRSWINRLSLPEEPTICDLGAGTGNYSLEAAMAFPAANVIHLDSDPVMNRTALRKYKSSGVGNISFMPGNVLNAALGTSSIDLIICVNALYTFDNVKSVLSRCIEWLKPGGHIFLIDLGRPMDVRDWSEYIIGSNLKRQGLVATMRAFLRGRKAIGQNRLIRHQQDQGRYWLHTPEEFARTLESAGLSVQRLETCYRGVCDLAICSR